MDAREVIASLETQLTEARAEIELLKSQIHDPSNWCSKREANLALEQTVEMAREHFNKRIQSQSALIERCEKALNDCKDVAHSYDRKPKGFDRTWDVCAEALAEIEAFKKEQK